MEDVIVIGGGIAGVSTAFFLAGDGVQTVLLERGELNSQASGANSGSLHAQIPFEPFAQHGQAWGEDFGSVVELLAASIRLWDSLPDLLQVERSQLEISLKGGLIVAATDHDRRLLDDKADIERRHGLDVQPLERRQLRDEAPYLSPHLAGGWLCKGEGSANPLRATRFLAEGARARGATLHEHAEVVSISREHDVYCVQTRDSRGKPDRDRKLYARRVVNAAGAQVGRIASLVGLNLSVEGYPIQASVTERVSAQFVPHLVYFTGEKLTLKQTASGTLIIGGGWPAQLDGQGRPVVDPKSLQENLAVAVGVVPELAKIHVMRAWAGIVNGTDDWKPIFGSFPGMQGFYTVFFPWLGFTAGPLSGRIIASLVQGKAVPLDLDVRPFLLS